MARCIGGYVLIGNIDGSNIARPDIPDLIVVTIVWIDPSI